MTAALHCKHGTNFAEAHALEDGPGKGGSGNGDDVTLQHLSLAIWRGDFIFKAMGDRCLVGYTLLK